MSEGSRTVDLERRLDLLARKWERFFARDRQVPVPPESERAAMERTLRDMSRAEDRSTAEQFRFEQLLHRFSTYSTLWLRQLRTLEESGSVRSSVVPSTDTSASASVSQTGGENGHREVYTAYCEALAAIGRSTTVDSVRFFETLAEQRRTLEESGVAVEGFEVVREDGKVKVRARVRRRRM